MVFPSKTFRKFPLLGMVIVLFLAGCVGISQGPNPTQIIQPSPLRATPPAPETAVPISLADEPAPEGEDSGSPAASSVTAVPFDLGETNLEQTWVANENLRNMPVRLEGMIAVPPTGDNLPIAVVIHGSHGVGCPSDEQDLVQAWPCPEVENHHYEGFAYLLEALAEQGYVAVSIDANPAYVAAFGDPAEASNPRLVVLFDLYLAQIAAAVNGEAVGFGVDLAGRVDWNKLVVLGHSQGGEGAYWIVDSRAGHTTPEEVNTGQGPIAAAVLLAPASITPREHDLTVPFAVLLPECDRDLGSLEGQFYYEEARQAAQRDNLAESVYLHGVNHNRFNSVLEDDTPSKASSVCASLLPAADVRSFLAAYVTQFFDVALGRVGGNKAILGLDAAQPAADTVLGLPALTSLALSTALRLKLPLGEEGVVGNATAVFCEQGFISEKDKRVPCGRDQLRQPGIPEEVAVTWDGQGSAYKVNVPDEGRDLSAYDVLHFRTAVNPVSELNAAGQPRSFSVQLEDRTGKTARVTLKNEPALTFPVGEMVFDDFINLNTWDNHVILSSVRIPLTEFSGVDLEQLQSITLVFDATDSGAIFLTDFEMLR